MAGLGATEQKIPCSTLPLTAALELAEIAVIADRYLRVEPINCGPPFISLAARAKFRGYRGSRQGVSIKTKGTWQPVPALVHPSKTSLSKLIFVFWVRCLLTIRRPGFMPLLAWSPFQHVRCARISRKPSPAQADSRAQPIEKYRGPWPPDHSSRAR